MIKRVYWLAAIVLVAPGLAMAVSEQAQDQTRGVSSSIPSQATERVPTQAEGALEGAAALPGEAQTLPVETDQGVERGQLDFMGESAMPSYVPRNERARERMSAVASAAEELIFTLGQLEGGIGEQISAVAREHVREHEGASEALDVAESRSGFARFFIGPNYSRLKEARQAREQNQSRIQQVIQQINSVTDDEIIKIRLLEEVSQMEMQDFALEEQIESLEGGFSLFGWLSKLINQ